MKAELAEFKTEEAMASPMQTEKKIVEKNQNSDNIAFYSRVIAFVQGAHTDTFPERLAVSTPVFVRKD